MGCGASAEASAQTSRPSNGGDSNPYATPSSSKKADDPQEVIKSGGIDRELDRARQQEELKVKLLLLGAGESGKSTIFKQMRILHGSPRTEDDLRMYGVVVRSNIITAMRKLCAHLRNIGLEEQLALEPRPENGDGPSGMTPKEAFDLIIAHVVDCTSDYTTLPAPNGDSTDWVGTSARAGLGMNNDAKQFLQLWRAIKILWEVRLFVSFHKLNLFL
jgi:hypothetical protein